MCFVRIYQQHFRYSVMVMVVLGGVVLVANKEVIYVLLVLVPVTLLIRFLSLLYNYGGMRVVSAVIAVEKSKFPLSSPDQRRQETASQGKTSSGQSRASN